MSLAVISSIVDLGLFAVLGLVVVRYRQLVHTLRLSATTDSLTGALNRSALLLRLDGEIEQLRRTGRPFVIAYADLDDLKAINDRLGHAAGDAHIVRFVHCLQSQLRSTDALGRVGGDEFVLLVTDTDSDTVRCMIQRLTGRPGTPSASFGVVSVDRLRPGATATEIIQRADEAMYAAKQRPPSGPATTPRPHDDSNPSGSAAQTRPDIATTNSTRAGDPTRTGS